MLKTQYVDYFEVNELQTRIMVYVENWARSNKKTRISHNEEDSEDNFTKAIPHKAIIAALGKDGYKSYTVTNAIGALLHKGYLRRAIMTSNKSFYVQTKSINQ